jgi:hypothetical protein
MSKSKENIAEYISSAKRTQGGTNQTTEPILNELLAKVKTDNLHEAVNWGKNLGKEWKKG